jgi:hypothetical protein
MDSMFLEGLWFSSESHVSPLHGIESFFFCFLRCIVNVRGPHFRFAFPLFACLFPAVLRTPLSADFLGQKCAILCTVSIYSRIIEPIPNINQNVVSKQFCERGGKKRGLQRSARERALDFLRRFDCNSTW